VHDIPNTPVKMWYTDRKEPVKIEYGVVDDSGNFSGIFKLYFINGNLWYADQIYAKYLFKSGKLQFWLDEGWNINEVCESDFLNRQKQLVEVAALLTQDLD
jgi:hypothetical protein